MLLFLRCTYVGFSWGENQSKVQAVCSQESLAPSIDVGNPTLNELVVLKVQGFAVFFNLKSTELGFPEVALKSSYSDVLTV